MHTHTRTHTPQQAVAADEVDELVLECLGVYALESVRVRPRARRHLAHHAAQRPDVAFAPVTLFVLPLRVL